MKDIMKKTIFAVVLISTAVLACSRNIFDFNEADKSPVVFDKDGYWKTPDFRRHCESLKTLEKSALFSPRRQKTPKSPMYQGVRKKSGFWEKIARWGEFGENSGRKTQ